MKFLYSLLLVTVLGFHAQAQSYNMTTSTINTCTGTFYDNGGTGNYGNNASLVQTFCSPTPGNAIVLNFSFFYTETNFDILRIYNGPNTSAPLLGTYSGTVGPGIITASSGCITISFTSNASNTRPGWIAAISCISNPASSCNSTCAGPAPANDACSGAQNLGTLPLPAACPSGAGALLNTSATNVCATAEVPYTSLNNCQPSGNQAANAADVWYRFTITAPTLNVKITGITNPNMALYTGSNCNNLVPRGCAVGANGILNTSFNGLAAGQYYLQISGANLSEQCSFNLELQNNRDCAGCVIQSALTVNPTPLNGTYLPGQLVNFCFTISDYSQTSVNWLHAVIPNFGPGWDMSTLTFTNPANCSGAGQWNWYNGSFTSVATGLTTGSGFYYDSPLGDGNGGYPDGNPGDNYGDNNPSNLCDWTFCFSIRTDPAAMCVPGANLNVIIDTYGDGETGSWTSFACNGDAVYTFFAELGCCTAPNVTTINAPCAGGTGSATATGNGSSPYSYVWRNGTGTIIQTATGISGSNTISNLPPGSYSVTVVDNNNCTTSQTFNILQGVTAISISSTNVTCNGSNNGSATVSLSGIPAPVTYSWSPSGGTSATASNLSPGSYTVTATGANGCSAQATANISQPPTLIASIATQSNVSCNGGNNGQASVSVTGGTPGYTYSWSPSGGSSATASGLSAGTYTCTVRDANNCTTSTTVIITQPTIVNIALIPTAALCNGSATGSINSTISGGTPGYTYSWSPGGSTTADINSIAAGTYTLTVTDSRGCTRSQSATVTQPSTLTANVSSTTNVLCNGGNNGSAVVTASGGTSPYTYSWSPSGGTSTTASGLTAGSYTVTIRDANNCTATAIANITQPAVLTVSIPTSTNVSCNGGNNGSATVSASGGVAPYTYSWSPTGGSNATANGLSAGSYTVTVRDANNCIQTSSITISQPNPVQGSVGSITDASCQGSNNGSATINASGGTAPYTYSWAPSGGNTSSASNLAAGNYAVTITDNRGCSDIVSLTISQPSQLVINTISQSNALCNGSNDGAISIDVSGGTAPYSYLWSPGGYNTSSIAGLSAGNYSVQVTDANGCIRTRNYTIGQPTILSATTSSTSVLCNGGSNGNATVVPSGGTAPYTYLWTPGGSTSSNITGLTAGSYAVQVSDAHGCNITRSVSISEPSPLNYTYTSIPSTCGSSNGSASIVTTGGIGPYTYSWAPSGGTGASANNLAAGAYTVTIRDANNCITIASIGVSNSSGPSVNIISSQNVSCFGGSNGSASATTSGGSGTLTYSWSPAGGNNSSASGLAAGNYTITVTDANNCQATASVTISQPTTVTVNATTISNVTCFNSNNGSATVLATGGTAPYTYSWSPTGGTNASASNLSPGTYTVTATDSRGCTDQTTIVITQPPILAGNISTINHASCNGSTDGFATVTANGGTAPYTYTWNPGNITNATISNIGAGTYTATILDNNGCSVNVNAIINHPIVLDATITGNTHVSCNGGNNGSATVSANGGTAPYTYSWSPSGGNNATANNLSAGNYQVTITDANGCSTDETVTINQPSSLTANITNATPPLCNGGTNGSATVNVLGGSAPYSYLWSPGGMTTSSVSNLSAGSYTITITDINGCTTTASVSISQPPILTSNILSSTNVSCQGGTNGMASVSVIGGTPSYTYLWSPSGLTNSTANGLSAGTYSVLVTDANGCTSTSNVTLSQPSALTTSISNTTNVSCFNNTNGSASVTASGGTAPYNYLWNPGSSTTATINNLASGTYSVTTTDNNGCTSIAVATISQPAALTATINNSNNVTCFNGNNGSATAIGSGGTLPYTYSWSPSGGNSASANNLTAGGYTINITDANGCNANASVNISQPTILSANIIVNDASCNGGSNGGASVTANGGTAPYSYSWTPGGFNTSGISNLSAGSYTVTITDLNNCTTIATANISEPAAIQITNNALTNLLCNNGTNGAIDINVFGGTQPYSYNWNPGNLSLQDINNLSAGTYSLTVTDLNNCTATHSVTLTEPSPITYTSIVTAATCGNANGSASISASGGNAPYTYQWAPNNSNSANASNLVAGGYTVTITDANGCSETASIAVSNTSGPITGVVSSTNVLCNGGNSGSAIGQVVGGTGIINYNWAPSGGNSINASNLTAGTYIFTATDQNGCSSSSTVQIAEPPLLIASISSTNNASCNGSSDGSITSTVQGGLAPYSYAWSPSGGNTATAMNLVAGNYTITVTDGNGCSSQANTSISEPAVLTATTSLAAIISCNGASDGSAAAIAIGGTAPYNYAWSPSGGNTATAVNLTAGSYSVSINDANGCNTTSNIILTEPLPLTTIINASNLLCNSDNSGSATAIASGGTLPYQYAWSPTGGNNATANGLSAGNYQVSVTDANGCMSSNNISIQEPSALIANAIVTPLTCNGNNSGSISIQVNGGTSPYQYNWNPNVSSSNFASGLAAGNYSISVADANGCMATINTTVSEPATLASITSNVTNVTCNGAADGMGSIVVSGGIAPYTYNWSPSNINSSSASGLTAGTYQITITDNNNCTLIHSINISEPQPLSATANNTNTTCGSSNGSISITAVGGTPNYLYNWSPSVSSSNSGNSLVAGNYTITITDANNCIFTLQTNIADAGGPQVSLAVSNDVLCNGGNNGYLEATVSGGLAPLAYSWSPSGGNNLTASNLTAGFYTLNVTDANGCIGSVSTSINEPPALQNSLSSIPALCSGSNDGTILTNPNGGTAPYSFLWSNGSTSSTLTTISAGSYSLTITDAHGCTNTTNGNVTEPTALSGNIATSNATCASSNNGIATANINGGVSPYTFQWSNGNATAQNANLAAGIYQLVVTDANNCTLSLSANITEPLPLTISNATITPVGCNSGNDGSISVTAVGGTMPYSYTWSGSGSISNVANNLAAGNYIINVTDANGCSVSSSFIIDEPTSLTANINAINNVNCFGDSTGNIAITAAGGTTPYTYQWNGSTSTTNFANSLAAGSYSVTITDSNGCNTTINATITERPPLSVSTSETPATCFNSASGSIVLTTTGGTAPYSYNWNPSVSNANTASNLLSGTYSIQVTDVNGCQTQTISTITEPSLISADVTTSPSICGTASGSAFALPNGGVSPYTYSWSNGGNNNSINAAMPGAYQLTITDANNCTFDTTINIQNTSGPSIAATVATDALCFGSNTGTASVNATGGLLPYTYLWSNGSTNSTANNLNSGNYTVVVTDANNCAVTATVIIYEPPLLQAATTATEVICSGGNTGSANVSISGGTSPYSILWSNGSTNSLADSLTQGSYNVLITDSNGCTVNNTLTINEPAPLAINLTAVNTTCFGNSLGSINTSISGGIAPYSYLWNNGATSSNLTNLFAGAYSVQVRDINGCQVAGMTNIQQPDSLVTSLANLSNVSCFNGNNGSIITNTVGGTAPYNYTWANHSSNSNEIINATANSYSLTVVDINGCISVSSYTITQPDPISISLVNSENANCFGTNTGSLSFNTIGGIAPYSYSWTGSNSDSASATQLASGNYTITVTDANGCFNAINGTIQEPQPLTISISTQALLCNNDSSGMATAQITGGTQPYQYQWSNGDTTSIATHLNADSYQLTVTDINGCSNSLSTNIDEPAPLNIASTITNASCNQINDGIVSLNISGGTPSYSFQWTPNISSTNIGSNLPAGNYQINVIDVNGCAEQIAVAITQPTTLTAQVQQTILPLCNGDMNGQININVVGGTAPYNFQWNTGATTEDLSNIGAGNYNVNVSDAQNCTFNLAITLTEPQALLTTIFNIAQVQCFGDSNAALVANPVGGTAPYTYAWSNNTFAPSISGLIAGTYNVTVTDSNNCVATASTTVNEPDLLQGAITASHVVCNGGHDGSLSTNIIGGTGPYSYSWSNGNTTSSINQLYANNYAITVTDANGCVWNGIETINQPIMLATVNYNTSATCNSSNGGISVNGVGGTAPYTYLWSNGISSNVMSNVVAGTYTLTLTDANNCALDTTFAIQNINGPSLSAGTVSNVSCYGGNNGSASLTLSSGTAPFTYLWSNGATADSAGSLSAGTYYVEVTDANSCIGATTITITEPNPLSSQISGGNVLCHSDTTGSANVIASGGTGNYHYHWSNGDTISNIINLSAGIYSVTITDDNGCTTTNSIEVTQPSPLTISGTTQSPSCSQATGSIIISTSGGTGPYTYIWQGATSNSSIASQLAAGNYEVTITDFNGCNIMQSYTLIDLDGPSIVALNAYPTLCQGNNTGSINLTVANGTQPISYLWSNGSTNQNLSNIIAGSYAVQVTDANGCSTSSSVFVNEPLALQAVANTTNTLCYNSMDGIANITVQGGTAPYQYNWANGDSAAYSSSLSAGNYTVNIVDANGCNTLINFDINQPPLLNTSLAATPVTCFGGSSGSIVTTTSGGTAPYTYSWFPSNDTISNPQNLSAGNHTVIINDANGCQTTSNISITETDSITTFAEAVPAACGQSNGSIILTPTGGASPYTITWNNGSIGNSLIGIPSGSYSATIEDANGCIATHTASISDLNGPNIAVANINHVNCFGTNSGSAEIGITNGQAPYTILWSNNETTSSIQNIVAGNYTVQVTDANGCSANESIIIQEPNALQLAFNISDVKCYQGADGSARILVSGGTLPYTYQWSNSAASDSISSLTAGTYAIHVTDANGCSSTAQAIIQSPPMIVSNSSWVAPSCVGGTNGSATFNLSGGTGNFNYNWNTGHSVATATNLTTGMYQVIGYDDNGCSVTGTFNIPDGIVLNANAITTNSNCGQLNGAAQINITNGRSPYQYAWNNGGNTSTATNLASGNYSVLILDADGCQTTLTLNVDDNNGPNLTAQSNSQVSCYGGANGSASATITSGNGPFTYLWSNGSTTSQINNLIAGNYSVTVTDINGCTTSESLTINEPSNLVVSSNSNSASCNQSNGTASVSIQGGISPYQILWNTNDTAANIYNLLSGTYTAIITDNNGCTINIAEQVLNSNGPTITLNGVTNNNCYNCNNGTIHTQVIGGTAPYQFAWQPNVSSSDSALNLPAGTYQIIVTDATGCTASITTTLTQPNPVEITAQAINATCGTFNGSATAQAIGGIAPYSYEWIGTGQTSATINNLAPGIYQVLVRDAFGQSDTATISISNISGPSISVSQVNQVSCANGNNGSISVIPIGGNSPYIYSWSHAPIGTNTANNLSAGNYTVAVTDANGCTSSQSISITEPSPITLNLSNQSANCNASNGSATATVSGGSAPYNYHWSTGDTNNTANSLASGVYTITVTDSNACSVTDTVQVSNIGVGTLSASVQSNVTCFNGSNGSATVTINGGTAPFTYNWTPGGFNTASVNNLSANTYNIVVTDVNGCIASIPLNITQPNPIVTTTTATGTTCGQQNGTATALASGGNGNFNYLWFPSLQTTASIQNLYGGNYTVIATDANGCNDTATVSVGSGSTLNINPSIVQPACAGINNGAIILNTSGGTAPYNYNWNNGLGNIGSVFNLGAGNYSVTITDANGCTIQNAILLNTPPAITANISGNQNICAGASTTISAAVAGGTPPYAYAWNNGSLADVIHVTPANNTSYALTVTDVNGCAVNSNNLTIYHYPALQVQAVGTSAICQGQQASVSAVASGGSGNSYAYNWNNGAINTAAATFSLDRDSTFYLTVSNVCGTVNATVPIRVAPKPTADFNAPFQGCAPVAVNFFGSTNVIPNCNYQWNFGDNTTDTGAIVNHLFQTPGLYAVSLTVTTAEGCSDSKSISNAVRVFPKPNAAFEIDKYVATILNSTFQFDDESAGATDWYWNFGDGKGSSSDRNPAYTYTDTGSFQVMLVVSNNQGCLDTIYNSVVIEDDYAIYFPNAFTPNGDGKNDTFGPYGVGYSDMTMSIFDRWGMEIYYTESIDRFWDGTFQKSGELCQMDVYVYKIRIKDHKGIPHDYVGSVTLVK
ncbi:MAG: hypothetical protein RIQ89_1860 [Bacteroidota bacterium]